MKRKFSKYARKTLSVFMAAIMVLSVFVFVPEMFTKAEAATAGTYDFSVRIHTTNDVDVGDNEDLVITLDYNKNNGTGSSGSTSKNVSYKWAEDANADNTAYFSGVAGFPTRVNVYCKYAWTAAITRKWGCTITVSVKNNNTDSYVQIAQQSFSKSGSAWGQTVVNYAITSFSGKPEATTISAITGSDTVTMPKTGASNVTSSYSATVYDQYGVSWYADPTFYVPITEPTSYDTAKKDVTTSGLSMSGAGVLTIKPEAQVAGATASRTVWIACVSGTTAWAKKKITLKDPSYTVRFLNASGGQISSTTVTYGVTPTAPTADYPTYIQVDGANHKKFSGWSPTVGAITTDTDYTAQYSNEAHSFTSSVTTTPPTCTTVGVTTHTCSVCGYSYKENTPATGHNYEFKGFTWSGYSSATATFVCSNDNNHTQTVTATITSVTDKEANCVETGSRTYTATAVFNSVTYTDTKTETIAIDNTNHKTLVTDSAVAATTDKVGLTQGEHCSACGTVTKAQEITPTVAKTKVYEGAITNNIKGSYTYLGVTAEEPTAMVSQTQPNCETTVTGTYGTINIENGEAVYTVTTMQFSGTETFYLLTKVENINSNNGALSAYVFEKVTIVPAKTLYYEDNFSSADGITYTDGVCSDGSSKYGKWNINNASSVNNAADEAADLVYNSDYKNYATLSGSSAHTVSVSNLNSGNGNKNWPSATFTFAGTGFDVISLTDSNSGVFYVTVYDTSGKLIKTVMMDTYYGYTYSPLYFNTVTRKIVGSSEGGVTVLLYPSKITDKNNIPANDTDYIVTSNGAVYTTNTAKASSPEQAYGWVKTGNAQTLYQVPVIHIDGLAYGTYTAKIEARFTGLFGHYNTDEAGVKYYDLCIDAIRINNPFNTEKADEAYEQSGQSRVNYTDIKSKLSTAQAASGATGLILLDGGKTVPQGKLEEYKAVSPKNELYISGGQSVAFDLDTADCEDVLIGMRSANSKPLKVQVIYDSTSAEIAINSGTELYYSILTALGKESLSGTVVIKNNTVGAILSLTNLKTVAKENTVSAAAPMMLSMFTAPRAMALLAMAESDLSIDEESVETATEEGKITLSVTTGSDVSSLIIRDENGNELTPDEVNSVVSGDEIRWTVTLTQTESGRYTYSLEGAYENGYTNGDTVEITVDVEITEPVPEEPEIPSDETEDSGKTDSFVELFDFLVSLLKKLLSRIFGVELV